MLGGGLRIWDWCSGDCFILSFLLLMIMCVKYIMMEVCERASMRLWVFWVGTLMSARFLVVGV